MIQDAERAYNPIIQAMIATANLQKQGQQQEIEKERNKQLAQQAKDNLKAETDRISNEHEHQQAQIELMGKAHSLAAEAQHMQTAGILRDLASKGVDVGKLGLSGLFTGGVTHGADPQQQLNTPPGVLPQGASPVSNATPVAGFSPVSSGGGVPDFASAFPGPEAEAARVKQLAAAQSSGAAEGQAPFVQQRDERQFQNEKSLKEMEQTFQSGLTDKKIASEEKLAKLSRGTQLAISQAANATHLQVAHMQYVPSDEGLKSMVVAGLTGAAKLNYANPQERAALSSITQMGGRPVDSKELDALKTGQALIPLFDKLQKFAEQLPDTRSGAFVQGHTLGAAAKIGWPTKTQAELANITSQALVMGRAIEGMTGGRVLAKQLELDLNSLASGGIPKQDALLKLQNLKDLYTNKQETQIMGGMPDFQKELIYKQYGIKPSWLATAPKTYQGHTLDEEESVKRGKPVYEVK